tara:strand:+ start:2118 stop:2612 length:495 start_codon:yes stop_codon:yes gene_type:complete
MEMGFQTTSFKTCLQLQQIMRITDPRWPAAREFSRMLLRTDELTIVGPKWLREHIERLAVRLGDVQPSRTSFPTFTPGEVDEIRVCIPISLKTMAICSTTEPPIDVLWLSMGSKEAWQCINSITNDLLDAGYPGCLGCGGPHSEEPWNEMNSRIAIKNSSNEAP